MRPPALTVPDLPPRSQRSSRGPHSRSKYLEAPPALAAVPSPDRATRTGAGSPHRTSPMTSMVGRSWTASRVRARSSEAGLDFLAASADHGVGHHERTCEARQS